MIWKEKYCIGVESVDSQHKELFERLNNFLQVVRSDKKIENKTKEIEKTLAFMEEYVVIHFDSEEAVQQKYNYPDYKRHHQIHESFKNDVKKFKNRFEQDKYNNDLIMEFSGRMLTWLINHVTGEDQNIARYVAKGENQ